MRIWLPAFFGLAVLLNACAPSLDGELLWRFETKKAQMQWTAADAQRLYLCVDDVYCLNKETGQLLWEFETFGAHSSAPVIVEKKLFFQCGGLYALDAATGVVLWEFWTKKWATLTPAVGAGRVYAPVGNQLYCLDAATGKRLWSVKTGVMERAPVLIGPRIFFSADKTVSCLDAATGKRLWSMKTGVMKRFPVLIGPRIFFSADKTIFCLNLSDGQVLWRFKTDSERLQLAAVGGDLLSVGPDGLVRAHDIETGKEQWHFDTGKGFTLFVESASGQVIIKAATLYLVDQKTGVPLWTFEYDHSPVVSASVLGNYLFVRRLQGEIFCVSLHDGALIRRMSLPDGGLLLTDTNDATFLFGGSSREVFCRAAPAL